MTQFHETHEQLFGQIVTEHLWVQAGAFLLKTIGELVLQQERDRNQIDHICDITYN